MSIALSQNNLSLLSQKITISDHNRSKLTPVFLHVGVWLFHRAHMALYLDELFSRFHCKVRPWMAKGLGMVSGEGANVSLQNGDRSLVR